MKSNLVAGAGLTLAVLVALATSWIGGAASERVALADLRGSNCDPEAVGTVGSEPMIVRGSFHKWCSTHGGTIAPVSSYLRHIRFDTEAGSLSVVANKPSSQVYLQLNRFTDATTVGEGSILADVEAGSHFLTVSLPKKDNVAPVEFELTLRIVPEQPEEQLPPTAELIPTLEPTSETPPTPVTEVPPTAPPRPPTSESEDSHGTECTQVEELSGVGTDAFEIHGVLDASRQEAACPQHSYAFRLPTGRSFNLDVATDGVVLELESPDGLGVERLIAYQSVSKSEAGLFTFRIQRLAYAVGPLNYHVNLRLIKDDETVETAHQTPELGVWRDWQFEGRARSTNTGLHLAALSSATTSAHGQGRITHLYLDFMLNMPQGSCERAAVMVSRGDDTWHLLTSFTDEDSHSEFTRVGFDLRDVPGRSFSEGLELMIQSAFIADDTWLQVRNLVVGSSPEPIPEELERGYNTGGRRPLEEGQPCFGAFSQTPNTFIRWDFPARRNHRYTVRVQSLGHYRPWFEVFSPWNDRGRQRSVAGDAGNSSARDDFRANESGAHEIWVESKPGTTPGEGLYRIIVTERGRDFDDPPTPEAIPTEQPTDSISSFILDHCKITGYADGCIDEAEALLFEMYGIDPPPTSVVGTDEPTPVVVTVETDSQGTVVESSTDVGGDTEGSLFAPLLNITVRCEGALHRPDCSVDRVVTELRRMARAVTDAFNETLGTNFTDDAIGALSSLLIEMSPDQGTLEAYRTGVTCGRPCWESGWEGDDVLEGREWAYLLGWTYSSIVPGWGNVHAARDLAYEINQCRGIIADGREGCSGVDIALDGIGIIPVVGGAARTSGAVAIRGLRQTTRWGWVEGAVQGAKKLFSGAVEHVFRPFRNTLIRWLAPQIGWTLHQFSKVVGPDWGLDALRWMMPSEARNGFGKIVGSNYIPMENSVLARYGAMYDHFFRVRQFEKNADLPGVFKRADRDVQSFVENFIKGIDNWSDGHLLRRTGDVNADKQVNAGYHSILSFIRGVHVLRRLDEPGYTIVGMERPLEVSPRAAGFVGTETNFPLKIVPDVIRVSGVPGIRELIEIRGLFKRMLKNDGSLNLDLDQVAQLTKKARNQLTGGIIKGDRVAWHLFTDIADESQRTSLTNQLKQQVVAYQEWDHIKVSIDAVFRVFWHTDIDQDLNRFLNIRR